MMLNKEKPFAGVLNDWAKLPNGRVHGKIEADARERFGNGEWITTSTVIEEDGEFIETRNSIYKLGERRL